MGPIQILLWRKLVLNYIIYLYSKFPDVGMNNKVSFSTRLSPAVDLLTLPTLMIQQSKCIRRIMKVRFVITLKWRNYLLVYWQYRRRSLVKQKKQNKPPK